MKYNKLLVIACCIYSGILNQGCINDCDSRVVETPNILVGGTDRHIEYYYKCVIDATNGVGWRQEHIRHKWSQNRGEAERLMRIWFEEYGYLVHSVSCSESTAPVSACDEDQAPPKNPHPVPFPPKEPPNPDPPAPPYPGPDGFSA